MEQTVISPGRDHRARLYAFCGVTDDTSPWDRWQGLANCIYERPVWHATALRDGRVLVEVERSLDSVFYLLPDRRAFREWEQVHLYGPGVRDPQVGRELIR